MKAFIITCFLSLGALAQVSAENPRLRLMPPGSTSTAGFVVLKNSSDQEIEIVAAKASFAKTIELHTHKIEDGIMQMRKVEKMTIPAKGKLELKPHSDHLMIFGMKGNMKEGEKHEIELKFSNGKTHNVVFPVVNLNK